MSRHKELKGGIGIGVRTAFIAADILADVSTELTSLDAKRLNSGWPWIVGRGRVRAKESA